MARIAFHWWGSREQPDLSVINSAIEAVFDGKNRPEIIGVRDTYQGEIVVAVCSRVMSLQTIQAVYEEYWEKDGQPWGEDTKKAPITVPD